MPKDKDINNQLSKIGKNLKEKRKDKDTKKDTKKKVRNDSNLESNNTKHNTIHNTKKNTKDNTLESLTEKPPKKERYNVYLEEEIVSDLDFIADKFDTSRSELLNMSARRFIQFLKENDYL